MKQNSDKLRNLLEQYMALPDEDREDFVQSIVNEEDEVNILSLFNDSFQKSHLPGYVDLDEIEEFLRKK